MEKLCLPNNPDYLPGTTGFLGSAFIYGADYLLIGLNENVYQRTVPCAVCYVSTRATVVMIPAKTECPSSWTREYYGYLTSEGGRKASFTCVDVSPESLGHTSGLGALFYYFYSSCTGLNCPPYEYDRILSCVVCTK